MWIELFMELLEMSRVIVNLIGIFGLLDKVFGMGILLNMELIGVFV